MRKKKLLSFLLLLTATAITSCDDDFENTPDVDTRLGVMTGTFIGNNWELDEKTEIELGHIFGHSVGTDVNNPENYCCHFSTENFPITIQGQKMCLDVRFYPFSVGFQFVQTDTISSDFSQSQVLFSGPLNNVNRPQDQLLYLPIKPHGIRLTINDLRKKDHDSAWSIKGEIDGILYNRHDLNDSIILRNVKFTIL